ncbi:Uncharacterised protein [Mycobacteroides abscessus subsp. abscessus]|nr:Uncharacterised protein [Mycobacteroides abscessus subsp. abscessus]
MRDDTSSSPATLCRICPRMSSVTDACILPMNFTLCASCTAMSARTSSGLSSSTCASFWR